MNSIGRNPAVKEKSPLKALTQATMMMAQSTFIMAQTAMLHVELESMKAANRDQEHIGNRPIYGEMAFTDLMTRYEPIIGYNACLKFLRGE